MVFCNNHNILNFMTFRLSVASAFAFRCFVFFCLHFCELSLHFHEYLWDSKCCPKPVGTLKYFLFYFVLQNHTLYNVSPYSGMNLAFLNSHGLAFLCAHEALKLYCTKQLALTSARENRITSSMPSLLIDFSICNSLYKSLPLLSWLSLAWIFNALLDHHFISWVFMMPQR